MVVDGAVEAPDTLGKLLGDKYEAFKANKGCEGIIDPAVLAETYWHLAHQPRNLLEHELDVRPWQDVAWMERQPRSAKSDSRGKGFAGPPPA